MRRFPIMKKHKLSVVVPAFNEQESIGEFHLRLSAVLRALPMAAETIYVNDGSRDQTLSILTQLKKTDPTIGIVDLSRNFGKEIALTAGIQHASGDAVVVIDADLQDPPEMIPDLVRSWREEGCDVVYAQRTAREGETWMKKATANVFYRIMRKTGRVSIPPNAGDFRLLSRRAVDALNKMPERHRFMKGLFTWIGFKQKGLPYRRDPRFAGQTKWNYWRLWNFAIEGFTSFTTTPLKIASYVGFLISIGAFCYAATVIYKTLVFGEPVAGYPSLMVVILFLGGTQLIFIGVIGEYLGRVFNETKNRPLYVLKDFDPPVLHSEKKERAEPA